MVEQQDDCKGPDLTMSVPFSGDCRGDLCGGAAGDDVESKLGRRLCEDF